MKEKENSGNRATERATDRQTDRQTDRERERERERERGEGGRGNIEGWEEGGGGRKEDGCLGRVEPLSGMQSHADVTATPEIPYFTVR